MSEVMKKTYKESNFVKVQLSGNYSRQPIGKNNEIVLQAMILNEKEILVEVIDKDKYQSVVGKS